MPVTFRLGCRPSPLAIAQAEITQKKINKNHPEIQTDIVPIRTEGDNDQTSTLEELGGKGVFIKEIELALLNKTIDIAVHSFKDITTELLPELELTGFLNPEAREDVLVLRPGETIATLADTAVFGTGSARRQNLIRNWKPNATFIPIRGNMETRIRKVDEGEVDAAVLSKAGLLRLGLQDRISFEWSCDMFLPAPGQGVIALETRKDDALARNLSSRISDSEQLLKSKAELIFLSELGFNCRDPLGIYSVVDQDNLSLKVFYSTLDGSKQWEKKQQFPLNDFETEVKKFAKECSKEKNEYEG